MKVACFAFWSIRKMTFTGLSARSWLRQISPFSGQGRGPSVFFPDSRRGTRKTAATASASARAAAMIHLFRLGFALVSAGMAGSGSSGVPERNRRIICRSSSMLFSSGLSTASSQWIDVK